MIRGAPCAVRHVRLDEPLAELALRPSERSIYAVFWWRDLPLGARLFTAGELPVPARGLAAVAADAVADAFAARADQLQLSPAAAGEVADRTLEAIARSAALPGAAVSVVVCTRGRLESLALCLDALARCDPAPSEIVVVDNAPETPETARMVGRREGVRYVAEPRPGLSRARNAGLAAAKGELVAFTDDDVEVASGWLRPIRAAFVDPAVGCVTGLVLPASLSSEAAFTFEFVYGGLAGSFRPVQFDRTFLDRPFGEAPPVWKIGAGANMALRKRIAEEIGGFDIRLGAGAAGCSEDSEFWHRALLAGWSCVYEPAAAVYHHHRDSVASLRSQMRAYIRGHVAALLVQFGQTRRSGNLMRILVSMPFYFAVTAVGLLLSSPGMRRKVFPQEVLGFLEGPLEWARRRNEVRE